MKKLLLIIFVFSAMVSGCSMLGIGDPPISISAKELVKAYKENAAAANGKYQGKTLAITGTVKDIRHKDNKFFDYYIVELEGVDRDSDVRCEFPDSAKEAIAKLKKGETSTLICTGDGVLSTDTVDVEDCRVQ